MKALIIVAHGSKLESSNKEIINIVENIKKIKSDIFVSYAFLELAEPSLEKILNEVCNEFKVVKVFPYFLAAGKHVTKDIPDILEKFINNYPNIKFEILPHIGKCFGVEELIISNS